MPRYVESSAMRRRCWRALAFLLLCLLTGLVQAQSADADDSADPPGRVARLSYIAGDLGFLPAGATDWSDADVNRPLTTGDRLSTAAGARAELEFGGGTLRIDGQTDLGVLELDDQMAQLELTQGTLNLTVRQLQPGQSYEIDTPTVALVIDRPGTFRVDIDGNGDGTQVTAFSGSANVYGENNAQRTINPGRSYRFADSGLGAVAITDIDGGDAFDAWCSERDRRYAQSTSRQYVADDVVGYQDLDEYGAWQDDTDYGAVWYPNDVAADWAPYRDGHWAYIAPWGWTWVDDSPWGYAPYHYGRWAHTHRGWGWIPGPRDVRAIYAPALVAFVGGGGWSIGIGGPVGWFPLGPGEIYNPWYRCGRDYYARVNRYGGRRDHRRGHEHDYDARIQHHYDNFRSGRRDPDERYVNRLAPHGITAVSARAFAGGRQVQRERLHVDPRQLATASVLAGGSKVRPLPGSVAPPRSAHARTLPAGGFNREVVARRAPPARHVPTNNLAGPRGAVTRVSNVRVLGTPNSTRPDFDRSERADAARSRVGVNPGNGLPRTSNVAAGMPAVVHRDTPVDSRPGDSRRNELPSARFAHPRNNLRPVRGNLDNRVPASPTPRPGVSYISNPDSRQPRADRQEVRSLPRPAQIRPATPSFNRPMPERIAREQAVQTMRENQPMPARNAAAPRFERADNPVRRAQPPVMRAPVRTEAPRQTYQPRAMPQQRAAEPRPQRTESRPARRVERTNNKDDHRN